ncbi:MAG TPA: FkbM family methyltransferase, partial [Candidatus Limnocylindria bacterium]|nr:FkbM family methyltransferase [Candidatus Limnocylindria bacterium]
MTFQVAMRIGAMIADQPPRLPDGRSACTVSRVFRERNNWVALGRLLTTVVAPIAFLLAIWRRRAPESVRLRTPTGTVTLAMRNFESIRTTFSIFLRRDYETTSDRSFAFVDVGANVGVAAVYFLSRHRDNTVICYEPDWANLPYLEQNLAPFGERARIVPRAVGATAGELTLYRSEDGKYSSLLPFGRATLPAPVDVEAFADVLAEAERQASAVAREVVVKIDVE